MVKTIEQKIQETEDKLKELKAKKFLEDNKFNESEWIKIPNTGYEVTKDVLHKGKSYDEIMELKKPEEELLTLKIIGIICENPSLLKVLKMDSSSTNDDFFFKQPFPQNKKKGYVARFYAYSDYANLDCGGDSSDSVSYLGVRFLREKKGSNK